MKLKNISFIDALGDTVISRKISALPIKEEVIIKESIKFFNDPEPCFIHRSAILNMIYIKLDNYLDDLRSKQINELSWDLFSSDYKDIIDIDDDRVTNLRFL